MLTLILGYYMMRYAGLPLQQPLDVLRMTVTGQITGFGKTVSGIGGLILVMASTGNILVVTVKHMTPSFHLQEPSH